MNRIVHEHYPVEKLPADLRPEMPDSRVRVVIEREMTDEELLADLHEKLRVGLDQLDAGLGLPAEEILARIEARFKRKADAAE